MKKSTRRVSTGLLALSMSLSPALSAITPIFAQEADVLAEEGVTDINGLVNPVVQHFTAASVKGDWKLDSSSTLAIAATEANTSNERLSEVVRLISSELKDKGLTAEFLPVRYLPADSAGGSEILIDLADSVTDETTSTEAYKIEISESGVRLTGVSEQGVLNGLHTIENLLITNDGALPYGTIIDYPQMAERRIHVDCGRKYISKDWFIRLIHEMSYMKINALQMHFSENLGFRIECETDPAIVSEQHLTKAEVREILAEAKKYGINVIPSFDSPGHVDQILKVHPEYGQVSTSGSHYASGLDITNPEAIEYIKSLYAEYCELFEGCTDFHIGGDEYMEFDRAPFTSIYQSVLDNYAVQKYGEGYTWKDTVAGYIKEIAEFVHERGFTPRIFNDGVYYGDNSSWGTKQKVELPDWIGVDFWSQMSWNYSIAKLQNIIDRGHKKLYNFNSSYFYYVLRGSKPTDGREQHSFDNLNADKLIYNEWTPGKFSANTIADDSELIAGCAIGIWCDIPDLVEEDVIMDDISKEMRAMASKAWNTSSPNEVSYEDFRTMCDTLGHAGAYEKGTKLEEAPEVLPSGDLGKVIVHYQDQDGNSLRADSVHYGLKGEAFSFGPASIYGYRALSDEAKSGVYDNENDIELTFVYEMFTDYSALEAEAANAVAEDICMPEEYPAYAQALKNANEILAGRNSHQSVVDEAVTSLQQTKAALKNIAAYALHIETETPLKSSAYESGFEAYQTAVEQAKEAAGRFDATQEEIDAAKAALKSAKEGLVRKTDLTPEVDGTLPPYQSYAYSRMFDGDTTTYAWFDGAQEPGQTVTFTLPAAVNMSSIRIVSPASTSDMDYIRSADVEVSADGETWTNVGLFEGESRDSTISFDAQPVMAVKLTLKENANNWYKICEVYFEYEFEDKTEGLRSAMAEAADLNPALYTRDSFTALIEAMKDGQSALSMAKGDDETEETALRDALAGLQRRGEQPEEANKLLLNAAIAYAQGVSEEDLVHLNELVKKEFKEALAAAIVVRDDAGATQAEVDAAWNRLVDAIHMLDFTADKDELNALIAQAEAIEKNLDRYEAEGQEEFLDALANARTVSSSETALDETIQAAASRLQTAMDALQIRALDTTMLEWLVAQVENEAEADYTPSTWTAFANALSEAQAVLEAPESQSQIDSALLSLNEAYLQLRHVPDEELLAQLRAFLNLVDAADFSGEEALKEECMTLCNTISLFMTSPEASQAEGEVILKQVKVLTEKVSALPEKKPDEVTKPEDNKKPEEVTKPEEQKKPEAEKPAGEFSVKPAESKPVKDSVKTASALHAANWMALGITALGAMSFKRRKHSK